MMNRLIISMLFGAMLMAFSGCQHAVGSDKSVLSQTPAVGLEIGNTAPEIILPDVDGKIIKLSSLRGKMVLVDFWASWCPPCRAENPDLVQAYNHLKDLNFKAGKGFTIYSVSLDRTKEAWLKGISEDHLSWPTHVSDLKYWKAAPVQTYNIEGIPMNYLLNEKGVILAKGLRREALYETLETLVIK